MINKEKIQQLVYKNDIIGLAELGFYRISFSYVPAGVLKLTLQGDDKSIKEEIGEDIQLTYSRLAEVENKINTVYETQFKPVHNSIVNNIEIIYFEENKED